MAAIDKTMRKAIVTKATIQGSVLEWALADAGLDRDDALSKVGLSGAASSTLTGAVELNLDDLESLAKLTHRSLYFFALPAPPEQYRNSIGADFRAPMSNQGSARELNPQERVALRDAKKRQQMAVKLGAELEHSRPHLLQLRKGETPRFAAKRAADWLGWADIKERRRQVKSKTQLFVALRNSLENQGIMTNLVPVDGDSFRGFCLHDDDVPLIFVNGSVKSPSARSFTLLHELGHLLRGVDKACDRQDLQSRTSDEAWCNKFAAAFLLPEAELRTYIEKRLKKSYISDLESVRRISNYFQCSWFSVAIRLKELNLAEESLVQSVSGDFQDPDPDGFLPGGQNRATKRVALFGQGFGRLLGAALSVSRVSEIEVRKTLRLETHAELTQFLDLARRSD